MGWLDAQIPRELLGDERTALRARAVVVASLVYLVINSFIGLLVIPVFVGDRPGAALVEVLLGVAGGACTLLLRTTRSVPLTANVLVGLGVLNIWSMSYLSGGADGAVLSCFIVIPFVAYALTDARTGAVWLGITWVSALALSALGDHHPSWPERFPRPAVVEGFLIAGLASGFYVVQALYHRLYQASLLRQEAAQHAAEAANRAKSAFLAAMSHELRTPMNGVLGVSDVLLRQPLPPDVQDMVGIIRRSSEALLGILNQILDLAKIEAGRFELEAIPFRVDELLREVQTLTSPGGAAEGPAPRARRRGSSGRSLLPRRPAAPAADPAEPAGQRHQVHRDRRGPAHRAAHRGRAGAGRDGHGPGHQRGGAA
jgi:signal transduction histidine kinase